MSSAFDDYFRPPTGYVRLDVAEGPPVEPGYFAFGGAVCYGRQSAASPLALMERGVRPPDVSGATRATPRGLQLPFDLDEVATNLRQERYPRADGGVLNRATSSGFADAVYYLFRPLLPVAVRRHLQRARFAGWESIAFPRWPVDTSVDGLMQQVAYQAVRHRGTMPFVWFWPDGAAGCLMLTHDVEQNSAFKYCARLMDLDEQYGFRSAFQLVPEERGEVSRQLFDAFRRRGFEANIHDLNHDGRLFQSRELFLARVAQINHYARHFGCRGFRSGAMLRRQEWLEDFEIEYDMSVPNVAHLEPQRGGCCTVMPYFVGDVLELPLTAMQDYTLFHILREYSIERWREQIELVLADHGLVSFITHPDYLTGPRESDVYERLLAHLAAVRDQRRLWAALPGEINDWWRCRRQMRLVPDGSGWAIEGPGSDRARVAVAHANGDGVVYDVLPPADRVADARAS